MRGEGSSPADHVMLDPSEYLYLRRSPVVPAEVEPPKQPISGTPFPQIVENMIKNYERGFPYSVYAYSDTYVTTCIRGGATSVKSAIIGPRLAMAIGHVKLTDCES